MTEVQSTAPTEGRETWTSNRGFILAAVGSAVGLGNIWRFPGVAYEGGGGAFLVPYLIALVTAGIPILFLDYAVGHRFRAAAPLAFRRMWRKAEALGWFQTAILFVIATYYAVIIAWSLSYFYFSFGTTWGDDSAGFFVGEYLKVGDPGVSTQLVGGVAWPLLAVWGAIIVILALGVAKGVEKLNVIGLPLLVLGFSALVIKALTLPGASDGLNALFSPDWSALSDLNVWIAAYSQIFFSMSIAFGIMISYASFQRRKANMTSSGLVVGFANSSFEILAGIGVFSTLGFLAHQQNVAVGDLEGITGPTLSFITFPAVISEMPGSALFGALFFGSLAIAGFTSLISLVLGVSVALQEKFGLSRTTAAVTVGVTCAIVSFALFSTTTGLIALDTVDQFANNIGIVVSAIAMCVITVWLARTIEMLRTHLSMVSTFKVGKWWIPVIGVYAPVFLGVMLIQKVYDLISEGYEGYPTWYVGVFGWGTVALLVVLAIGFTAIPWRGRDDASFRAWPEIDSAAPVTGGVR
ncbi:neurotransmitter:Na+ symporter, NSS family [Gordonia malaquae]|uniref:Putative NSS family transporter n=1 Tax=Gordonia malaquae NBRC 108250 TaxID=1223542 RepID=M3T9H1_GORML|nr:sodium-dependent transporter [Gordonia malaquae]GAC78086.1 putative NSS family transporter [Gordonia malaquae NBRC 108250]SED92278.1 neurotransmitter:Na+ symporter, NSS family [Gordonia malaquae]